MRSTHSRSWGSPAGVSGRRKVRCLSELPVCLPPLPVCLPSLPVCLPSLLVCLTSLLVCLLVSGCDQAEIAGSKCSDDHPCPTRYACVEGICYPKGPLEGLACSQTEDCPAGVCLVQSHVCVACIHHEDCVSRLCEPQTHICLGCKADYQCPGGSCDRTTGICAESPTEDDRRGN